MITGVTIFLYDVVLYGIILQYGMANIAWKDVNTFTKEHYKAMYFH